MSSCAVEDVHLELLPPYTQNDKLFDLSPNLCPPKLACSCIAAHSPWHAHVEFEQLLHGQHHDQLSR